MFAIFFFSGHHCCVKSSKVCCHCTFILSKILILQFSEPEPEASASCEKPRSNNMILRNELFKLQGKHYFSKVPCYQPFHNNRNMFTCSKREPSARAAFIRVLTLLTIFDKKWSLEIDSHIRSILYLH